MPRIECDFSLEPFYLIEAIRYHIVQRVGRSNEIQYFLVKEEFTMSRQWQCDVKINTDGVSMLIEQGGVVERPYIYHMFAILMCKSTANRDNIACSFFYEAERKPHIVSDMISDIHIEHGKHPSFTVSVDERDVESESIMRLSFCTITDAGAIVLSCYPALKIIARPCLMFFSRKNHQIVVAQHLTASWLLEINGKKNMKV